MISIAATGAGIDDMIHHRKDPRRIGDGPPGLLHRPQRRRAGTFMQENAVDRDQGMTAAKIGNAMGIPDFGEQRLHYCGSSERQSRVTSLSWIAVRVSRRPFRIQCQVRQRF